MIMQILIRAQVYKMKIIQYQKGRQELFKFVVLPEARLMRSQKMCLQMTCIEVPWVPLKYYQSFVFCNDRHQGYWDFSVRGQRGQACTMMGHDPDNKQQDRNTFDRVFWI